MTNTNLKEALEPYVQKRIRKALDEVSVFVRLNGKCLTLETADINIEKDFDEIEVFVNTKEVPV